MEPAAASRHAFDYLVIVDFEATCDEGPNPAVIQSETQEIIEFPWVVFDPNTLQVIDKQQLFVKPQWVNSLPRFCTQLTGITDAQLETAPPLVSAVRTFDEYLGANFTAKSKSFCIVTDGGWDLKQALMRECKKKDIILAPHYFRFFDLKVAFLQTMKMSKPLSLKAMAMALGTPMEKHHSGIADCMTISHIVHQLIVKGFKFATPEQIPVTYDPDADRESFPAFNTSGVPTSPPTASAGGDHAPPSVNPFGAVVVASAPPMPASAMPQQPGAAGAPVKVQANLNDPNYVPRLRPGDWICPQCKDHNYAMRAFCRKCNTACPNGELVRVQPQPKEGDWICPSCSGLNFASRDTCYTCHASRFAAAAAASGYPAAATAAAANNYAAAGAATNYAASGYTGATSYTGAATGYTGAATGYTGAANYAAAGAAANYAAYGAAAGAYGAMSAMGGMAGGVRPQHDWRCNGCGELNFGFRQQCRRCGTPESLQNQLAPRIGMPAMGGAGGGGGGGAGGQQAGKGRPGDWYCGRCKDMNYMSRDLCRKCQAPKSEGTPVFAYQQR